MLRVIFHLHSDGRVAQEFRPTFIGICKTMDNPNYGGLSGMRYIRQSRARENLG